jgi:Transglutaminase-like superfamily
LLLTTTRSLRQRDTTETLRRLVDNHTTTDLFDASDALRAVRRAARAVRANCLAQSVALTVAFARAGQQPQLVLGCRRYADGNWGAHAWVLLGPDVLDPLPSGPHAALATLEGRTHWVPSPIRAQPGSDDDA